MREKDVIRDAVIFNSGISPSGSGCSAARVNVRPDTVTAALIELLNQDGNDLVQYAGKVLPNEKKIKVEIQKIIPSLEDNSRMTFQYHLVACSNEYDEFFYTVCQVFSAFPRRGTEISSDYGKSQIVFKSVSPAETGINISSLVRSGVKKKHVECTINAVIDPEKSIFTPPEPELNNEIQNNKPSLTAITAAAGDLIREILGLPVGSRVYSGHLPGLSTEENVFLLQPAAIKKDEDGILLIDFAFAARSKNRGYLLTCGETLTEVFPFKAQRISSGVIFIAGFIVDECNIGVDGGNSGNRNILQCRLQLSV